MDPGSAPHQLYAWGGHSLLPTFVKREDADACLLHSAHCTVWMSCYHWPASATLMDTDGAAHSEWGAGRAERVTRCLQEGRVGRARPPSLSCEKAGQSRPLCR